MLLPPEADLKLRAIDNYGTEDQIGIHKSRP